MRGPLSGGAPARPDFRTPCPGRTARIANHQLGKALPWVRMFLGRCEQRFGCGPIVFRNDDFPETAAPKCFAGATTVHSAGRSRDDGPCGDGGPGRLIIAAGAETVADSEDGAQSLSTSDHRPHHVASSPVHSEIGRIPTPSSSDRRSAPSRMPSVSRGIARSGRLGRPVGPVLAVHLLHESSVLGFQALERWVESSATSADIVFHAPAKTTASWSPPILPRMTRAWYT